MLRKLTTAGIFLFFSLISLGLPQRVLAEISCQSKLVNQNNNSECFEQKDKLVWEITLSENGEPYTKKVIIGGTNTNLESDGTVELKTYKPDSNGNISAEFKIKNGNTPVSLFVGTKTDVFPQVAILGTNYHSLFGLIDSCSQQISDVKNFGECTDPARDNECIFVGTVWASSIEEVKHEGCELFGTNNVACAEMGITTAMLSCCKSESSCTNEGGVPVKANSTTQSSASSEPLAFNLCSQIPDTTMKAKCTACQPEGVWTAVGCIKTDAGSIVKAVMRVGISIAGGVALIMILAASFMLSISQGDPKRTSEAREYITSAVIGLFFIIFSVTILQFIGVDILRIPGFGG